LGKRLFSSFINGLSGGVLATDWLSHLGITSFFIPLFIAIGTAIFYLLCGLPKYDHNKKLIAFLIFVGGLILFITTWQTLHPWELLMTAFFLLVVGLYPLFLRNLAYMKSIVISACWTFFTLILPVWMTAHLDHLPYTELVLMSILFYALTIPSDIRDSESDPSNLRTLPQLIGALASGLIGMSLIVLFGFWNYLINGSTTLFLFSVFELTIVGCYLYHRKDWLVNLADASLMLLGFCYFFF